MPARWNKTFHWNSEVIRAFLLLLPLGLGTMYCRPVTAIEYAYAEANLKTSSPEMQTQESLLAIEINGQRLDIPILAHINPGGRILLKLTDVRSLRLAIPTSLLGRNENDYVQLEELGLTVYQLDNRTLTLKIETGADSFNPSSINAQKNVIIAAQKPSFGGYLNYDFLAQHYQDEGTLGTQLELGLFNQGWTGTTGLINLDLDGYSRFIRQNSTLTLDLPMQRASFRLGDGINRSGAWGRPVHFGGIQWSTNFATQPDFITFPLPSLSGSAALPSTAEVFVNNVRSYRGDIEPGPFTINELPVVTGQGEVQLVVQDQLGREQVISQSFYASQGLLKPGIDDFSYELGSSRQNFGTRSNDYGDWLFSATRRKGFTNELTGEWHGEVTADHQTFGLSATSLLLQRAEVNAAIATSRGDLGSGWLLSLGFNRKTPRFGMGIRTQLSSRDFDQLGRPSNQALPSQQTNAYIGWHSPRLGSFGVGYLHQGYLHQDNRSQADNRFLTLSYSHPLNNGWSLGVSAFGDLQENGDSAISLVLTHALGTHRSNSVTGTRNENGTNELLYQLQRNLPAGEGMGYRLLAGSSESYRLEGSLSYQNNYGSYGFDSAHARGHDAYRAKASGSLALFNGGPYLARKLGNSFAVVEVANYSDVRIYAENQMVARTNNEGRALVPNLRAYQRNRLRVEQLDIPLTASIERLEIDVVPYQNAGYSARFPITKTASAELRINLPTGEPIAAGSSARIINTGSSFPIAGGGSAYFQGLQRQNLVRVTLPDGQTCEFDLTYDPTDEPLPDLGTFVCHIPST